LTAGEFLRLDGCRTDRLQLSVLTSVRRRSARAELEVHRVSSLPRADRVVVDGIPCTTATRTILDSGRMLDPEALEVAFESARRMGLSSVRVLRRCASELGIEGRRASRSVNELLKNTKSDEAAAQFRLEVKMARLLRASSPPVRQFPVGKYRIDFAFPDAMVGVECEGFDFHGHRIAWKRDKRRSAWLETQGWRLVFVTWDDVTRRPGETMDRIAIALASAAA
jgi:very-short-patch-repair endonuclease